ncbi:MAG: hypothetical protein GY894_03980 [Planctomycetes bacterium]|nr:hypothetical protein [Planctomycetota bacterium]MCP4838507.1 hypothetical protein [Planctomycetota bacterium]
MSENLILEWALALPLRQRLGLAVHLRQSSGSEAAAILMAYSQSAEVSVGELSALLPGMLVYARQAASRVIEWCDEGPLLEIA